MKQIRCEMCGNSDLIKQDGVFVCQFCGAKYTLEEAKKLLIEGVVDVSGSAVKIDDSERLVNYYQMAESAFASNNFRESESYCNKILESDLKDYMAWFLKGKSAGRQSTVDFLRVDEVINCFTKSIENAPEQEKTRLEKNASEYMVPFLISIVKLCCDTFVANPTKANLKNTEEKISLLTKYNYEVVSKWGGIAGDFSKEIGDYIYSSALLAWENVVLKEYKSDPHPTKEEWKSFMDRGYIIIELIQLSLNISSEKSCEKYNSMIIVATHINNSYGCLYNPSTNRYSYFRPESNILKPNNQKIYEWKAKIRQINPQFNIYGKKGCYIATAVYGSYDCPEVWTLRRFRDYSLSKTWYGRGFIRFYYAISPTLVKWFGDKGWFRNIWKKKLDRMVKNLIERGYESSSYED
ncbi:MAG: hypothetical protein IKP88_18285 [Lachnospiraceae bacterium]|nr:hypothetical protein [Lachnospiraceae bacterium]